MIATGVTARTSSGRDAVREAAAVNRSADRLTLAVLRMGLNYLLILNQVGSFKSEAVLLVRSIFQKPSNLLQTAGISLLACLWDDFSLLYAVVVASPVVLVSCAALAVVGFQWIKHGKAQRPSNVLCAAGTQTEAHRRTRDIIYSVAMYLFFAIYSGICHMVLLPFAKVSVAMGNGIFEHRLTADAGLGYHSGRAMVLQVTSAVLFILYGLLPLWLVFYTLRVAQRRGTLDTVRTRRRLGFMFSGYDKTHPWWEAVVLLRRTLISAIVALVDRSEWQVLLAQVVLVLALGLQLFHRPYERNMLNQLEWVTLSVLLVTQWGMGLDFTIQYNLELSLSQRGTGKLAIQAALLALNCCMCLVYLVYFAREIKRTMEAWRCSQRRNSLPAKDQENIDISSDIELSEDTDTSWQLSEDGFTI